MDSNVDDLGLTKSPWAHEPVTSAQILAGDSVDRDGGPISGDRGRHRLIVDVSRADTHHAARGEEGEAGAGSGRPAPECPGHDGPCPFHREDAIDRKTGGPTLVPLGNERDGAIELHHERVDA